ncbi:hypothetical protein PR048_029143 [Dryococelus australis]|uniref:TAR DNA-binding protein 43 N-terminal domain-containing protein n=1 Tax=Dryococelus australis TaxID=614101 RepID=A0ABQ9GF35_9NEOP|nr:hypothetical protein PR048_029143 [Dryococelus australis]
MSYLQVAEDEGDEPIELPTEDDNTLLLSTLAAQYPGTCGLRYRNPESKAMRGIRLADGRLHTPRKRMGQLCLLLCLSKRSSKKQKELSQTAEVLSTQLLKLQKLYTVRRVASKVGTITAVTQDWKSLVTHLENVGCGKDSDSNKAKGILKTLKNESLTGTSDTGMYNEIQLAEFVDGQNQFEPDRKEIIEKRTFTKNLREGVLLRVWYPTSSEAPCPFKLSTMSPFVSDGSTSGLGLHNEQLSPSPRTAHLWVVLSKLVLCEPEQRRWVQNRNLSRIRIHWSSSRRIGSPPNTRHSFVLGAKSQPRCPPSLGRPSVWAHRLKIGVLRLNIEEIWRLGNSVKADTDDPMMQMPYPRPCLDSNQISRGNKVQHHRVRWSSTHLRNTLNPSASHPTAFTAEEERAFLDHIMVVLRWGFPIDVFELRLLSKSYLDAKGIIMKSFKNNLPGVDWVCFTDWFHKIIEPWARMREEKKILIGDNLSSHFSVEVLTRVNDVLKNPTAYVIHFVKLISKQRFAWKEVEDIAVSPDGTRRLPCLESHSRAFMSSINTVEYTFAEYTYMILVYGTAEGNGRTARRLYQEHYPQRATSSYTLFTTVTQLLQEQGTFANRNNCGAPKRHSTPELEVAVLHRIEQSPSAST